MASPKKVEEEKRQKEGYRLWYEYLRRNRAYEEVCQRYREVTDSQGFVDTGALYEGCSDEQFEVFTWFDWFGDVHEVPFDEWWEEHVCSPKNRPPQPEEPLMDFTRHIGEYYRVVMHTFLARQKRPDVIEFQKALDKLLEITYQDKYLFLMVDRRFTSLDKMTKQFRSLLKKTRIEPLKYPHFSGKLALDELERYLRVYDLKQTLTTRETIKEVYREKTRARLRMKKKEPTPSDLARMEAEAEALSRTAGKQQECFSDLKKAKKIITFVEKGIFPGPYDPTKDRRNTGKTPA
jgi:hypothetical protein